MSIKHGYKSNYAKLYTTILILFYLSIKEMMIKARFFINNLGQNDFFSKRKIKMIN